MRIATLTSCVTLAAALAARAAGAQIFDPRGTTAPKLWLSAGVGYQDMGGLDDGRTNSAWDFRGSAQFRGSLEMAIGSGALGRGSTVGVVGTWSHVPMIYFGGTTGGTSTSRADAHADISSLMAQFRAGGSTGVHQVIEISAGVMRYANFTRDDDKATLPPASDTDFAFTIGYGIGFGLGRTVQAALVQDYGLALHQKTNLGNDGTTSLRQQTTRLAIRLGLGGGRARR